MTEGDLGFADSYINGDFSFVDKDKGLLNLFMVSKKLSCVYTPIVLFILTMRIFFLQTYFLDFHCQ